VDRRLGFRDAKAPGEGDGENGGGGEKSSDPKNIILKKYSIVSSENYEPGQWQKN
jgi:hypothetical protein